MIKKWKVAFISGLAVVALAGCNAQDKAVVEMKHDSITQDELYNELKERYGQVVLDEMVQKSIILDKYKVTDKEMETRLEYYKKAAGIETEKDFETYVKAAGYTTMDDFKEDLKFNIAQVNAVTEGIKIDEKDIKERYEENKVQISASHILVEDEALANEIYQKITNKTATFEEMVSKHSTDTTSAANEGSLGFFSKGTMDSAFEEVAFGLKKGEVSKPVHTQFGYHIIRLDDKKEDTYEELKPIIEEELKMEQAKSYDTILEKLTKEYKMEIKDEKLKAAYEAYQQELSQSSAQQ